MRKPDRLRKKTANYTAHTPTIAPCPIPDIPQGKWILCNPSPFLHKSMRCCCIEAHNPTVFGSPLIFKYALQSQHLPTPTTESNLPHRNIDNWGYYNPESLSPLPAKSLHENTHNQLNLLFLFQSLQRSISLNCPKTWGLIFEPNEREARSALQTHTDQLIAMQIWCPINLHRVAGYK